VKILITNDDGIFAPGLEVLERTAGRFGEVTTVVPDRERSAVSHAITLHTPLRVQSVGERRFIVDGTPADCVWLALNHVLEERPDVVLSGVNHGPNLGHDVVYSGTVAGALEGSLQGLRSMAVSFIGAPDYPVRRIEHVVDDVLARFIENPPAQGTMLNVNIPHPDDPGLEGIEVTRLGMRFYSQEVVERKDPRGRRYVWIGGANVRTADIPGSDCNAIAAGRVSVTPIRLQLTDLNSLDRMAAPWSAPLRPNNEPPTETPTP